MLLIRSMLEEEPARSLENSVSLECGKSFELRCYIISSASIEWRALCRIFWVHSSQFVDNGGIGLGNINFFDVGSELLIGATRWVRSVNIGAR
jgi:hypothetical protein